MFSAFSLSIGYSQDQVLDSAEAQVFNDQAWEIMYSYPDSAYGLCIQALDLITPDWGGVEHHSLTATLFNTLAVIKWIQTDYPKALMYFNQSLELREDIGDSLGMASTLNNIGNIYYPQAQYPSALKYFLKSLKIRDILNNSADSNTVNKNKKGLADAYLNIGNVHYAQFEYENALEYYFMAVEIQEEIADGPDITAVRHGKQAMALSLNNIGGVYMDQSNFPLGLDYFIKALKIRLALANKKGVAQSYSNIGSLYLTMYTHYQSEEEKYRDLPTASTWWAETNPVQLLDTAMVYQQRAYRISKELSDKYGMTFRLYGMARIYYKKKEYTTSIEFYQKAELLSDSISALRLNTDCHSGMARCYEKLGKYQLALEHFKTFSLQKDSMFNEEKNKDLGKLEAKHEFETAESERKRFDTEKSRVQNERIHRRDLLQYSVIAIVIVLIFATVIALTRISISPRLLEGLIFLSFLLFFEFMLVLLDPYIERFSGGAPAFKLIFNAALAAFIFPLHSFFEVKLKRRIS